ncbi:MAG: phosphoribosylglycinamide formyltransferase [Actinomycetia bacterium]|nr:phosphoribosylglycinamide formyltransferase [Actinomycetes bacterium]
MPSVPVPLAVLVSGEGSNLQALMDQSDRTYTIAVVISDRSGIGALSRARNAGIPTEVLGWADFVSRDDFTTAVCDTAQAHGATGLVLAGFMRILSPSAMSRFPDAIINVHPALLPSFPGADAVEQALERGVAYTGVTVHFVDEQVDHGPIIAQRPVRVNSDDDAETLHSRIQEVEHDLFPEVVAAFARGDIHVESGRVRWKVPLHTGSVR